MMNREVRSDYEAVRLFPEAARQCNIRIIFISKGTDRVPSSDAQMESTIKSVISE